MISTSKMNEGSDYEFKWCETCKEYDQEKHCCHRYSKVIRDTVEEMKQEQEPRKGHWIRQTDDYHDYYECEHCGIAVGIDDIKHYCPNCGVRMVEPQESEDKE